MSISVPRDTSTVAALYELTAHGGICAGFTFKGSTPALVLLAHMHSDSRHPPSIIQLTSTADSDPDPSRWLESWDVLSTWVPTYPTHIAVEEDGTVRMNGKRIG